MLQSAIGINWSTGVVPHCRQPPNLGLEILSLQALIDALWNGGAPLCIRVTASPVEAPFRSSKGAAKECDLGLREVASRQEVRRR
jgi:hypothetical protein